MPLYRLLFTVVLISLSDVAWSIEFSDYHSQHEINSYMREIAQNEPNLATFETLGQSLEGREISMLVLSKGGTTGKPGLYLNGTHHGDEKASTEAVLGVIHFLVENKDTKDVEDLLSSYAIYLQPLVNPDGHALAQRNSANGRDPNRDYSYPNRSDNLSFHLPSTQIVKKLTDRVKFRAAIAFHSGMEGVLWPWCHTSKASPDRDLFFTLSRRAGQAMGMRVWRQSYNDYPTTGEFIDYAYWAHQTLAVTFEVSYYHTPNRALLSQVVERSVAGSMAFIYGVLAHDRELLTIVRPTEKDLAGLPRFDGRLE